MESFFALLQKNVLDRTGGLGWYADYAAL